jgi:hypothetical protein
MHMFPLNHLQMSMYRISVISSRPRSPPPGVDEIAAVAKAITETEGRRGPVASVGLGKTHGFDRGPWKMHGETRWNPVKPGETRWNPEICWRCPTNAGFSDGFLSIWELTGGYCNYRSIERRERESPATETCKLWLVGASFANGWTFQAGELRKFIHWFTW